MGGPHEGEHGKAHPRFSSNRAVREYTEDYYIPAADTYKERVANGCSLAGRIAGWQNMIERTWPAVRFGKIKVETSGGVHRFTVRVYPGSLDLASIGVQLYAEGTDGEDPFLCDMAQAEQKTGPDGYVYKCEAPANRPASDYTPRIIPRFPGASVPLEAGSILWQR